MQIPKTLGRWMFENFLIYFFTSVHPDYEKRHSEESQIFLMTNHVMFQFAIQYSAYAERCRENTNSKPQKCACGQHNHQRGCGKHKFQRNCRNDQSSMDQESQNGRRRNWLWNNSKIHDSCHQLESLGGYWNGDRRRQHVRFSTNLYTEPDYLYGSVIEGQTTSQTDFFELKVDKRKQLYRVYMELVCYVPWQNTTFGLAWSIKAVTVENCVITERHTQSNIAEWLHEAGVEIDIS